MEAQLLEMPRSASRTPSSPSVPRPWGPVEAGGEEGHDVFSPSWRILRVDLLSSSLAKDHFACLFSPLCLSVLSFRPASLPPNSSALRSRPSGLRLRLLSAASAPGCSWTPGRNLHRGLQFGGWPVPQGAPPGVGGQGRSRQGGEGSQLTWAAERRPLQSLWTVWEGPLSPLSV